MALTQIKDTLYKADGSTHRGSLIITWQSFNSAAGDLVEAGTISVPVADGVVDVSLEPNDTATPAGIAYRVEYRLVGEQPTVEYWSVPTSGSTLTIGDVRLLTTPGSPMSIPWGITMGGTGATTATGARNSIFGVTNPSGVLVGNGASALSAASAASQLQGLRRKPNITGTEYEFASPVTANAADYNFPAQAPGGSLSAATPATVTLTPVPLGVNGADTNHYLYVSGGTGTPEVVLITGGTAISGAATGTITFTPANSHSGAWTVQSASAGIDEALRSTATPHVHIASGNYNVRATITVPAGATIEGPGSNLSSAAGAPTTINYFDADTPLFKVYADHVTIKGLRLALDASVSPAVAGSVAVDVLNCGGGGSAASGTLHDLDIYGFYNGVRVDGTSNFILENIAVNNTEQDAFVLKAAQGYATNLQAINCKGNSFTLAAGTYGLGTSPFMRGVHSFSAGGWGVYATYPVQMTDLFLNNEKLGNFYLNVPGSDAGFVSHGNFQYAGQNTAGYGTSLTAPAISLAGAGSAPSRFSDISIFSPNGDGLLIATGYVQLSGLRIIGPGQGAQAGSTYCVDNSGGSLYANQLYCAGPVRFSAGANRFTNSIIIQNSATVPALYISSGAVHYISGNHISQAGAAEAIKIDAGVTLVDGTNSVVGTISNSGSESVNSKGSIAEGGTAWAAVPTLQNSWVDFGGGDQVAQYRKDKAGRVWIRGQIKNGTSADGTLVFTFPAGFRPPSPITLFAMNSGAGAAARFYIGTDGTVKIYGVTGNTWLAFGNTSFSTL